MEKGSRIRRIVAGCKRCCWLAVISGSWIMNDETHGVRSKGVLFTKVTLIYRVAMK